MDAAVNSENGVEFSLLHSVTVDFGSESVELLEHMLGKCINTNLTGIPQPSWPKIYFRVSNETPLKSATSLWHTGVCVKWENNPEPVNYRPPAAATLSNISLSSSSRMG